jgi:DNA-directed RNA polymerase specialized sigma24 family protein
LEELDLPATNSRWRAGELLALDEAPSKLAESDQTAAELVKLRYFAGLTMQQAAEALGVSLRTAERL